MNSAGSGELRLEVPLDGHLEGTSVPEILLGLYRGRHTGALLLQRGSVRKVLYLRDGQLVFTASTDPEDRLGALLFRRGEVDLTPLLEAGGEVARGRRLGQILVERGIVEPASLVRAVLDQVREIALSVFAWRDGTWRISRAQLPSEEPITLDLPMEELILAGVRRVRDGGRVRRLVGGPRAVYRAVVGMPTDLVGLGLTEKGILEELRRPRRVDQICLDIFAPSEVVFRSMWALSILGLIERVPAREYFSEKRNEQGELCEGFLDNREGASDLLLELGDQGFSGSLRLYHGAEEGVVFLRNGLVEFARTTDPELSLSAHLLRRGVISDRDRNEAQRRLGAGKRMGDLLAERGALDEKDVQRFVQEQVLEIVRRLVLWKEGEYEVIPGDSAEERILLNRSPEDVILSAFETLEACERIWAELGGLSTVYRLRPEYLQRLDRILLRPGVWELVTLLSQERTVDDILLARPEPDFEVCRWLCGLQRVHVIERVPLPELLARARGVAPAPWTVPAGETYDMAAETPPPAEAEAPVEPRTAAELAPELFSSVQPQADGGWEPPVSEETVARPEPLPESLEIPPAAVSEPPLAGEPAAPEAPLLPQEEYQLPAFSLETPQEMAEKPAPPSGVAIPTAPVPIQPPADAPMMVVPGLIQDPGRTVEVPRWLLDSMQEEAQREMASQKVIPPAVPPDEAEKAALPEPESEPIPLFEEFPATEEVPNGAAVPPPIPLFEEPPVEEAAASAPIPLFEEPPVEEAAASAPIPLFEEPPVEEAAAPAPIPLFEEPPVEEAAASAPIPLFEEPPVEEAAASAPIPLFEEPPVEEAAASAPIPLFEEPPVEAAAAVPPPMEEPVVSTAIPLPVEPEGLPITVDREPLALLEEPAPTLPEPPSIPPGWDLLVARFNRRHAFLFEALRREVGAGAKNLVLTCLRRLGGEGHPFCDLEPDREGHFDETALLHSLAVLAPPNPEAALEGLITFELGLVRDLLPPPRLRQLTEGLSEI